MRVFNMRTLQTTSLIGSHFTQQPRILAKIAGFVGGLDIVFTMIASTGDGDNVVKMQIMMRQDVLFANVAPCTIPFKNTLIVNCTDRNPTLHTAAAVRSFNIVLLIQGIVLLVPKTYLFFVGGMILMAVLHMFFTVGYIPLMKVCLNLLSVNLMPLSMLLRLFFTVGYMPLMRILSYVFTMLYGVLALSGSNLLLVSLLIFLKILFSTYSTIRTVSTRISTFLKLIEKFFFAALGANFEGEQGKLSNVVQCSHSYDLHFRFVSLKVSKWFPPLLALLYVPLLYYKPAYKATLGGFCR